MDSTGFVEMPTTIYRYDKRHVAQCTRIRYRLKVLDCFKNPLQRIRFFFEGTASQPAILAHIQVVVEPPFCQ